MSSETRDGPTGGLGLRSAEAKLGFKSTHNAAESPLKIGKRASQSSLKGVLLTSSVQQLAQSPRNLAASLLKNTDRRMIAKSEDRVCARVLLLQMTDVDRLGVVHEQLVPRPISGNHSSIPVVFTEPFRTLQRSVTRRVINDASSAGSGCIDWLP